MPLIPQEKVAPAPAQFIFTGTVQKLKSATMSHVPVTERTAIVRVDEVIQAPEMLCHCAGQNITVQVGGRKKLSQGQQATFYTEGVVFGESIAVHSTEHRIASRTTRALAAKGSADPVQNLVQQRTEDRFRAASLVVSGKVMSIQLPETAKPAKAKAAAMPEGTRISEHEPVWQEAVIRIDTIHKGSHPRKMVTLRFPGSTDVMWHRAPKFHPGQEGVFMLHTEEPKVVARPLLAAVRTAETTYTALHPEDFHPSEEMSAILPILSAGGTKQG